MPSSKQPDEQKTPEPESEPVVVQTPKEVAADEAALAAEISAAHVEVAVEHAEADAAAAQKAADKATPNCPHCGHKLKAEHDLGDHLHCDSPACIECCFSPSDDGPVLRPNYPPCPSDKHRVA